MCGWMSFDKISHLMGEIPLRILIKSVMPLFPYFPLQTISANPGNYWSALCHYRLVCIFLELKKRLYLFPENRFLTSLTQLNDLEMDRCCCCVSSSVILCCLVVFHCTKNKTKQKHSWFYPFIY